MKRYHILIILHNFRKLKKKKKNKKKKKKKKKKEENYLPNTDQIHINHHLKFALSRYSLGKHNDGMISGHA